MRKAALADASFSTSPSRGQSSGPSIVLQHLLHSVHKKKRSASDSISLTDENPAKRSRAGAITGGSDDDVIIVDEKLGSSEHGSKGDENGQHMKNSGLNPVDVVNVFRLNPSQLGYV